MKNNALLRLSPIKQLIKSWIRNFKNFYKIVVHLKKKNGNNDTLLLDYLLYLLYRTNIFSSIFFTSFRKFCSHTLTPSAYGKTVIHSIFIELLILQSRIIKEAFNAQNSIQRTILAISPDTTLINFEGWNISLQFMEFHVWSVLLFFTFGAQFYMQNVSCTPNLQKSDSKSSSNLMVFKRWRRFLHAFTYSWDVNCKI